MGQSVVKSFSYNPEDDPDVEEWIASLPPGTTLSEALRALIRRDAGAMKDSEALVNIYDLVKRIWTHLRGTSPTTISVTTTTVPEVNGTALPADMLAELDRISSRL